MSPSLILAILVLAVLGLAALVVALVRASARGKRVPPVWPAVAERLGLDVEATGLPTGDGTLAGRCLGFEVGITVETLPRGHRRVSVKVGLAPPLDLGMTLGSEPRLREPVPDGATPFATGNPALDRALEPRARDARGARRLFERKILRDRLETAMRRWPIIAVGDASVTLGGDHPSVEPLPIDELLADATSIARLIDEDRPRIRP